jgi:DNA transformation protein
MPVTPSYRQYVLDQLSRVTMNVRARSMFGGVGLYAGSYFFALIARDTLYFKVDESNRGDFERRGMGPFLPFGDQREIMHYYEVPADILEEPEALAAWVEKAVEVARRAKRPRSP